MLHICTHYSNLIKVSERVVVRCNAGDALVHILPMLRRDQRNEVVVELGKGLEMGQYEISKYIPEYRGQAALYLYPSELDEQVLWLKTLLGSPNDSAVSGALNTIGVLLQHYPAYRGRFVESAQNYEARRQELLGLLLQGLAHYRPPVRQEALLVTGKLLFESNVLSMDEKAHLFSLSYRKLLFLIQEAPVQDDDMTFFYRAAALAHINRFIALWRLDHGPFSFTVPKKVAFFPGTFDPFTLSHKGIVHAIRDLGFEVYLAVDEFSWSKKAQPHLIRRQIVNLSVAGDFHVHLFPDDIPVNIANPADLKRLRNLFPDQEVYLVVGSDVVGNASCFQAVPRPWSIHSMNLIIFRRAGQPPLPSTEQLNLKGACDPAPAAPPPGGHQLYPYPGERGHEPGHLHLHRPGDPGLHLSERPVPPRHPGQAPAQRPGPVLPVGGAAGPPAGGRCHCWAPGAGEPADRYPPGRGPVAGAAPPSGGRGAHAGLAQLPLSVYSRPLLRVSKRRSGGPGAPAGGGKTLFITGLAAEEEQEKDYAQLLVSEVLSHALEAECVYAVFHPHEGLCPPETEELFRRQGFIRRDGGPLEADRCGPVVLLQNLETTIQEPPEPQPQGARRHPAGHQRLQTALTGLYPGNLVLTLSADVIHHRLLRMITQFNQVPPRAHHPPEAGEIYVRPLR